MNNNSRRSLIVARDELHANINRNRIFPPYIQNPTRILTLLRRNNRRSRRNYNGFGLCRIVVKEEARIRHNVTNDIVVRLVANLLWRESNEIEKNHYIVLARIINN